MTGLDENKDHILEIAAIVTDYQLNVLDQKHYIVYQTQEILDNMNDWCKEHHGKSGLTQLIATGTALYAIEQELTDWLIQHFGKKQGKEGAVLAGNSIHNDRKFLDKYLPTFSNQLHYRMVDVSSFKEIYRERWGLKYDKKNPHRAIDDLHESIAELKYYLGFVKT